MNFNEMPWLPPNAVIPPQPRESITQSRPLRQSVSVACVPCRTRHLKCGGGDCCTRCLNEGLKCTYVKSRRGFKGPRKAKQPLQSVATGSPTGEYTKPEPLEARGGEPRVGIANGASQTTSCSSRVQPGGIRPPTTEMPVVPARALARPLPR
jgi:hypothetical protein